MFRSKSSHHIVSLRLGVSALALMAAAPWASAFAQANADQVEQVTVTGFRASLNSAIDAKREAIGVVDVIKAQDIASFPDLNLAESLQRIPGVTISRVSGEGREISVRGLGPDYTRVRIDGIEALATSGSSDSGGGSGTNRSRGFDFNVFASELFGSLTVHKSASADIEEGSLGATVDLATPRPFDYDKPQLVFSAQAGYNDGSQHVDPRFAALASDTWLGGKLGALVSVAFGERHIVEKGFSTTLWDYGPAQGGFCSPAGFDTDPNTPGVQNNPSGSATNCGAGGPPRLPNTPAYDAAFSLANAITTFEPRNPGYNSFEEGEHRLGVTGSFQYQPTDATLLTLDVLYGQLDQTRNERAIQAIGLTQSKTGKPETTVLAFTVDPNNNLQSATFGNVDMRTQTRWVEEGTKFQQYTLSLDQKFGALKITGLAGYADSRFATPNDTTITFDRANSQGYSIDFTHSSRTPDVILGFDPTDPANWSANNGTSEVRLRPGYVDNQFVDAKLGAEYPLNDAISIKVGGDIRDFTYNSVEERRNSETVSQTLTPDQLAAVSQLYTGYRRGINLQPDVATSWIVPNVQAYAKTYDIYCNCGIYAISSDMNSSARGNTDYVQEVDTGGYAMANYNFTLFDIPFRGDAGVRYVSTTQSSAGYAAVGSTIQWVTAHRGYDDFLPSMNLAADIDDDTVVRFASAETIARPSLSYLTPGGKVSVQGGANRTFSTGNPDLKPTKSLNFDLSYEWYPTTGALYSVGLFFKHIDTFAQTLRSQAVYNTLGLPNSLLDGTTALPTDVFQVTQPVNSSGGNLQGIELNAQQPFTFLPSFWRHFGALANLTYVDSSINYMTSATPGAPTVRATLVGLSKYAANATLYYENDTYSIRGSVAYRSDYLTNVPGRDDNNVEGTNSTVNVDMQATYNFNDKVKLTFEALNLTNQAVDTFVGSSNRVNQYLLSGREYYLGVRYAY